MNDDVEQLLREGLDRFAAAAQAPAELVTRARRRCFHRRIAMGSAIASGTAAVTAVAVVALTGAAGVTRQPGGASTIHARADAYVVLQHVARAVAAQRNRVMDGRSVSVGSTSSQKTSSVTWSYRGASRFEEYASANKPYLSTGTAEIGSRLVGVSRRLLQPHLERGAQGVGPGPGRVHQDGQAGDGRAVAGHAGLAEPSSGRVCSAAH